MNDKVLKITNENFISAIEKDEMPTLVDFYADWCGPCKMQSPIIDELAIELDGKAVIAKANTDECYDICVKYGIASIPTLLLFKGGEVVGKFVGLTSKEEILDLISKNI